MAQENQIIPILAPAKFHPRSDQEFAVVKPRNHQQHKSSKCLVYFLALIVIASAIALIFSLAVMRPRSPDAHFNFVSIKNLKYNNNASYPSFNLTLEAELSIKNPNFGRFKFQNPSLSFLYGHQTIGESRLRDGFVAAKETEVVVVTVDVKSYRISDIKSLSSQLSSGNLRLSTHAKLSGRVHLLKIVKKKRTAFLDCTMSLNLTSRVIEDLICD